jgi:hypothetical protein
MCRHRWIDGCKPGCTLACTVKGGGAPGVRWWVECEIVCG